MKKITVTRRAYFIMLYRLILGQTVASLNPKNYENFWVFGVRDLQMVIYLCRRFKIYSSILNLASSNSIPQAFASSTAYGSWKQGASSVRDPELLESDYYQGNQMLDGAVVDTFLIAFGSAPDGTYTLTVREIQVQGITCINHNQT